MLAAAVVGAQTALQPVLAGTDREEIEALKKQIELLTSKVLQLEKQQSAGASNAQTSTVTLSTNALPAAGGGGGRGSAAPAEVIEKIMATPSVKLGSTGLNVTSADGNFMMGLHALLQMDSRSFFDDGGVHGNDGFLLRRARPVLEGTLYRDFDILFSPEFGTSANGTTSAATVQIQDAYLNYRYGPALQLRVGRFKTPVSLEFQQAEPDIAFNERGLPVQLASQRDVGVQLHGQVLDGRVSYAAGIFNGVGDNRNSTGSDFEDHKEFAGRVFFQPLLKADLEALRNIGFGLGSSYGDCAGATGMPALTGTAPGYSTDAQQQFFAYKTTALADGTHWRLAPQAYYYYGPFGLISEYLISAQDMRLSSQTSAQVQTIENQGWQVTATYVLTGEENGFRGLNPIHPFNPREGHWGAFQLAARYEQLNVDPSAFTYGFASGSDSARGANAWSVGLNWWLNRNMRVNTSFSRTVFTGGGGAGSGVTIQPENVSFTRIGLFF